jgi:hypothetical protein
LEVIATPAAPRPHWRWLENAGPRLREYQTRDGATEATRSTVAAIDAEEAGRFRTGGVDADPDEVASVVSTERISQLHKVELS